MIVALTEEDLKYALDYAERKWALQVANKIRSKIQHEKKTDVEIIEVGMLGEIAVGRTLGLKVNDGLAIGDGGVDFTMKDGTTIQVKTGDNKRCVHFIITSWTSLIADIGIYCRRMSKYTIKIDGYITKDDFKDYHKTKEFGKGLRKCVHIDQLEPIDDLFKF